MSEEGTRDALNRGQGHISSKIRFGVGALISIIALTVYVLTLAPTVTFIDSGELTAVCATLGVAHPTGYPIYTLLGRLFTSLPFGSNKVFLLNLMSALFASLSLFVMYHLLFYLQNSRNGMLQKGSQKGEAVPFILLTSVAGALLLGFSKTFWSQALVAEVYTLNALFVSGAMLFLLKATGDPTSPQHERNSTRLYALFAFLFGLGMANHMTIVVLVPACLYLLIAREGIRGLLAKGLKILLPFFLLGISCYLYLPVRSAVQPALDWGNPETVVNLFRHLSGKQYQVWMFTSFEVAAKQLSTFVHILPQQFSPFLILLALLGLWWLYRRNKRTLYFTSLVFGFDLLYSINYDIHDIDAYFLPSFIVVALWIGLGLVQTCEFLKSGSRTYQYAVAGLVLVSPLLPLRMHHADVDHSREYFVHDYCHNLLKGVGQGGIIISRQWDFFCSPFYYFQYVEGLRPDVVLIEQELLRRSWYYPQLQRQYPWLIRASQREVSEFLSELEKFEKGKRYNPVTIQKRYIAMIDSFIAKNIGSRPVYLTPEVEPSIGAGYVKVPEGLAYRLYQDDRFHSFPRPEFHYRGLHDRSYDNYFHQTVITFYSRMWASRAVYLSQHGRYAEALEAYREALWIDPDNQQARRELKRCETLLEPEGEPQTP